MTTQEFLNTQYKDLMKISNESIVEFIEQEDSVFRGLIIKGKVISCKMGFAEFQLIATDYVKTTDAKRLINYWEGKGIIEDLDIQAIVDNIMKKYRSVENSSLVNIAIEMNPFLKIKKAAEWLIEEDMATIEKDVFNRDQTYLRAYVSGVGATQINNMTPLEIAKEHNARDAGVVDLEKTLPDFDLNNIIPKLEHNLDRLKKDI